MQWQAWPRVGQLAAGPYVFQPLHHDGGLLPNAAIGKADDLETYRLQYIVAV